MEKGKRNAKEIKAGLEQLLLALPGEGGAPDHRQGEPGSVRGRDPQAEALRKGGAKAWADAFASAGTRVSSLIRELIADRPAGIALDGARIASAADMAALVLPLRSPFVESMKAAASG